MKSVTDLILNKKSQLKREKRGKITAASLTAAGAAVLAATQAEAQSVDGFEDITSSVLTFERLGNGQVEFELENGQRFIANEGQYIIDGSEILVSNELVTVVGGAGINPTVIAVAVAGAALLVGLLILANADDDDASTTTTTTTTTTTVSTTINASSSGTITGGAANTAFAVTAASALTDITSIDGGAGTDTVSITAPITGGATVDLGSLGVTLSNIESFEVTVNSDGGGGTIDMNGEDTALVVNANTDSETITVTDLGPQNGSPDTAKLTVSGLAAGQRIDVDLDAAASKIDLVLENAGDAGTATVDLDNGTNPTVVSIMTTGTGDNDIALTAASATTFTVTGSQGLDVTNAFGTGNLGAATSINASGASGVVELLIDSGVTNVDMGSANDILTLASNDAAADTYSGGAGTDTLDLAGFNVTAGAVDGFEKITTTTGGTIDFANFDTAVNEVTLTGGGTVNVNALDLDNLLFTMAAGGTIDIDATGTTAADNIRVEAATGSVTIDTAGATSLDIATVNQSAAGTITLTGTDLDELNITGGRAATLAGSGTSALTDIDVSAASSLNLTGSAPTALADFNGSGGVDDFDATLATSADIDLEGGNDDFTVVNSAGVAHVDAGAGDDTVTVTATGGAVTVVGGAGQDSYSLNGGNVILDHDALTDLETITSSAFNSLAAFGDLTASAEVVTNFTTGADDIDLFDLTADDNVADIGAFGGDFNGFQTAVINAFNAGNDIVIGNDGTDYFVLVDVAQNMPGAVGSIGIYELDAAIVAGDII